jgi:hypothetical protein
MRKMQQFCDIFMLYLTNNPATPYAAMLQHTMSILLGTNCEQSIRKITSVICFKFTCITGLSISVRLVGTMALTSVIWAPAGTAVSVLVGALNWNCNKTNAIKTSQ